MPEWGDRLRGGTQDPWNRKISILTDSGMTYELIRISGLKASQDWNPA
ncbi:MAG: hypothetical protein H6618_09225 [Deltaproteobacteria bacterium]|nr:hypothetical protein [Deltaproteobacteria bacterium]